MAGPLQLARTVKAADALRREEHTALEALIGEEKRDRESAFAKETAARKASGALPFRTWTLSGLEGPRALVACRGGMTCNLPGRAPVLGGEDFRRHPAPP